MPQRYDLKGYERVLSITKQGCCRVAHALQVSGPVDLLLEHLVPAFRMVLNRHPKMRALMSNQEDEPMTSYIQPPFTNDAEMEHLVNVVHGEQSQENGNGQVRKLIEEVCNQTVDRTVQFPYFLTVHIPRRSQQQQPQPQHQQLKQAGSMITLLLFSDHVFSDGYSGMIVLNDLLVNLRLLILLSLSPVDSPAFFNFKSQLDEQCQELPLRPSLYDQLMGPPAFWKRCMENVINVVGRMMVSSEIRRFQPLLSPREELVDTNGLPFPFNKTYCLLDSGTKENLDSALEACHKENVTLHGAIVACILMAHIKAKYPDLQSIPKSKFKVFFDVDYNMRRRVKEPFSELTVGANICIAGLEPLASHGFEPSRRFWDMARWAKRLTDANVLSTLNMLSEMIFCHHSTNVTTESLRIHVKKSVLRDVNLSNLGRYPFPIVHQLGTLGDIRVEGLHLYNSMPHVGNNAVVFVTSTDHLNYAMANRLSDDDGSTLFRYVVKCIEAISTIGPNETMLEACERILLD